MCDKNQYREQGYTPRKPDALWDASPMNPDKPKKKPDAKKYSTGTEFQEDHIR